MIKGNDVENLANQNKKFKFMAFSLSRFLTWLFILPYFKISASSRVKFAIMKKTISKIKLDAPEQDSFARLMFEEWLYRNNYKIIDQSYNIVYIKPITEMEQILYE